MNTALLVIAAVVAVPIVRACILVRRIEKQRRFSWRQRRKLMGERGQGWPVYQLCMAIGMVVKDSIKGRWNHRSLLRKAITFARLR